MKYLSLTIVLLLLLTISYKKEAPGGELLDISTLPDLRLPTHDAQWKIHIQGDYDVRGHSLVFELHREKYNRDYFMGTDTASHIYITVTALGQDTVMQGVILYKYAYEWVYRCKNCQDINDAYTQKYNLWLREDTITHNIYYKLDTSYPIIDYSDKVNTGSRQLVYSWPVMNIQSPTYLKFGNYKMKVWYVKNPNDGKEYFYKGWGIGNLTGVSDWYRDYMSNTNLPDGYKLSGHLRSLDFRYMNDSVHFDYPLN